MNGQELLEQLQKLTPEQRQLCVVVEHEGWHYDTTCVRLINCNDGLENEDPDEAVPINAITIGSVT